MKLNNDTKLTVITLVGTVTAATLGTAFFQWWSNLTPVDKIDFREGIGGVFGICIGLVIYFIPSVVAAKRVHSTQITLINLFWAGLWLAGLGLWSGQP